MAVAAPESLRCLLTAALLLASAYHLSRVPRVPGAARVSEILHLTMGVAMVAMLWPWGEAVPPSVWVTVFTASTGWFVVRALRATGRRLALALFATSMAAMAWMGATMPAMAGPAAPPVSPSVSPPMVGMAMDGMTMGAGHLTTTGVISGVLGGYLVLVSGWWFVRGLRLGGLATTPAPGPRPLNWSAVCHGLMSVAMGLALLAMA
jgi:hypothetical protein